MTRYNTKGRLASLLSASMVFTMLAPALPAYANIEYRDIKFDTGIYEKYEGVTLPTLSAPAINTPDRNKIIAKYTQLTRDTSTNGQALTSVGVENAEMPWWEVDWDTYNTAVENGNIVLGNKPSASAGNFSPENPQIVPFNFEGYSFAGWYEGKYNEDPTLQRVNKLPKNFPPVQGNVTQGPITYHARYMSDGTKYTKRTIHSHNTNLPIFGLSGNVVNTEKTDTEELPVLIIAQARPLIIPGFKATLNPANIKMFNKGTNVSPAMNYTQYGFAEDTDNNVTGPMVNKDIEVKYDYEVDDQVTFSFISEHIYIAKNNNGIYEEESQRLERVALHAGEEINDTTARVVRKPDQEAIANRVDAQGDTKYKLVTTDGINPNDGSPLPANLNAKAPAYTSGINTELERYVVGHENSFENGYMVNGHMPNQSMSVKYYYVANDDYDINLTVRYKDESGENIAELIKTATNQNFTIQPNGDVEFDVTQNTVKNVPLPDLTAYGYGTPSHLTTAGAFTLGSVVNNFTTTQSLDVEMRSDAASIEITYEKDPGSWATGLIGIETIGGGNGGRLYNHDIPKTEYDNSQANPISIKKNVDGSSVNVNYSILPEAEPNPGFVFDGYYDANNNLIPNTGDTVIPATGNFIVTAKFSRDTNWKNFKFKFGSGAGYMTPTGPVEVAMYPFDPTGTVPRVVTLDDMLDSNGEFAADMPTVVLDNPGTDIVKWYDENGNEVLGNTDIAARASGEEFTAYIMPVAGYIAETPYAETNIDSNTGVVSISVVTNPATGRRYNSDPNSYYAVTDDAGNIVSLVQNRQLQNVGGVITDGIEAGRNYKIYEVGPAHGLSVGDSITAAPIVSATPATVTTPVSLLPTVEVDTDDDRFNQITINPTTPNTQYALLDDAGNVVADWRDPIGNSITFKNLVPDGIYHVVTRPITDNITSPVDSNIANLPVVATIGTGRNVLSFIGITQAELTITPNNLDINNIPRGESVSISAPSVDSQGRTFKKWSVVSGNVTLSGNSRNIVFTMPVGNVLLEALYDDGINHSDWASVEHNNTTGDGKSIGTQTPLVPKILTPIDQELRVNIDKHTVPTSTKNDIAELEKTRGDSNRGRFTALWEVVAKIEQRTIPNGIWSDYVGPITEGININIDTGMLRNDRNYVLYHLASDSNASPSEVSGVIDPNWALPDSGYPGNFALDVINGDKYVFGYTTPDMYRVIIRDGRDNTKVTHFDIRGMQTVNDHASSFSGSIVNGPYIDISGITFEYLGLSTDKDSFQEYDSNLLVTSDLTLYLYYQNDKEERREASKDLKKRINSANELLNSDIPPYLKPMLQTAMLNAKAILDKVNPRKSSTSELQEALDALQEAILKATGNSSHSGGSSGGSGGGGSIRRNGTTGKTRILSVGIDGNWELVNLETHEWVFNLESGNRTKGWNLLSYTYNGKLRSDWYYFADNNIMRDGWLWDDTTNKWYYLSEVHDGFFGKMNTGWHYDQNDNKWYYLDEKDGSMKTGWQNINGIWYYLNPTTPAPTWEWNADSGKWVYNNTQNVRPLGSMFSNEITPDGFKVDASGAWVK